MRVIKSELKALLTILLMILSPFFYVLFMAMGLCGLILIIGAPLAAIGWVGEFMVNYLRECGWGEFWVMFVTFITVVLAAMVAFFVACAIAYIPVGIANDVLHYIENWWKQK